MWVDDIEKPGMSPPRLRNDTHGDCWGSAPTYGLIMSKKGFHSLIILRIWSSISSGKTEIPSAIPNMNALSSLSVFVVIIN